MSMASSWGIPHSCQFSGSVYKMNCSWVRYSVKSIRRIIVIPLSSWVPYRQCGDFDLPRVSFWEKFFPLTSVHVLSCASNCLTSGSFVSNLKGIRSTLFHKPSLVWFCARRFAKRDDNSLLDVMSPWFHFVTEFIHRIHCQCSVSEDWWLPTTWTDRDGRGVWLMLT